MEEGRWSRHGEVVVVAGPLGMQERRARDVCGRVGAAGALGARISGGHPVHQAAPSEGSSAIAVQRLLLQNGRRWRAVRKEPDLAAAGMTRATRSQCGALIGQKAPL
jgi:hypothetical protein